MVFEKNTFKILHGLTEQGKIRYEKFLERKADDILFKHQHPIKYFFRFLKEIIHGN